MGKIWIEISLISARGLRRTSSLFKLQWFAVGWIDPRNKYCTKIDASGNANPVWKTKFSSLVDNPESKLRDLALQVEVYCREPIFLRESLQGTATVVLKEFLDKYVNNSEVSKPVEEVGSFQLRKRSSSKPQGFVDISIRISEEREEPNSYPGKEEGFQLEENRANINIANGYGSSTQGYPPQLPNINITNGYGSSSQPYPPQLPIIPRRRPENEPETNPNPPYAHPMPLPPNYSSSVGGPSYPPAAGPSYQPPRTPPPPPPPSNVGYIPTFLPRTEHLQPSYMNLPSSGGRGNGAGFGMGMGAGALAAGAVIFGDDFMSGFDFPGGLQDASLTISADPPF